MATFVEKIFNAPAGTIVFRSPDIVLTHDNTVSIEKTFLKMNGKQVFNPDQLMVVLDHNAPPTSSTLATSYDRIRNFVKDQGIKKFHDAGDGICHQLMADYARPGMVIVGSDSHTCTAGAFNAMAAGIDRTETAGIWKRGETWFRVPETIRIKLSGSLPGGVYAKDLSLWIIGILGSSGANYASIEFWGDGVKSLSVSQRMTLANLASEMGAKNAVFPADEVLEAYFNEKLNGIWGDEDSNYLRELEIDLNEIYPLVATPHQVDNIQALAEVAGTPVHEGVIGTCTNGRLEDLAEAASYLRGKKVKAGFQLVVIPASKSIYLEAMDKGYIRTFLEAGANVLSASCGPCLGTGQGIPADGYRVISTANRNFRGRMGNTASEIYLASPAAVAQSAVFGKITDPRSARASESFPYSREVLSTVVIEDGDQRKHGQVWDYSDVDNLNTDQMFAGHLTYKIQSSDPIAIKEHLFADFDPSFASGLAEGDVILAGENFGCGSSREHPAVGLAGAGVKALIVKSVNRIFFRACINQGLPLIVLPDLLNNYEKGNRVELDLENACVYLAGKKYSFEPLPGKLLDILNKKGLVNYLMSD